MKKLDHSRRSSHWHGVGIFGSILFVLKDILYRTFHGHHRLRNSLCTICGITVTEKVCTRMRHLGSDLLERYGIPKARPL